MLPKDNISLCFMAVHGPYTYTPTRLALRLWVVSSDRNIQTQESITSDRPSGPFRMWLNVVFCGKQDIDYLPGNGRFREQTGPSGINSSVKCPDNCWERNLPLACWGL
jgi:hypothetical protein